MRKLFGAKLIDKAKLIEIEQQSAGVGQTVFTGVGCQVSQLGSGGFATDGSEECLVHGGRV